MKKNLLTLALSVLSLTPYFVSAQNIVEHLGIAVANVDVTNATDVGHITFDAPSSGTVIVHFDGDCYTDVGDLVILAASNTIGWTPNDGNTSVEATDSDLNHKPFSHTRVYSVAAGTNTFYAIAQNYVETAGNGLASIYGSLTVEFIPFGGDAIVGFDGVSETNVDLASTTALGQVTINPTVAGKAIVRFDGTCYADLGDRIVLAASDNIGWSANDGNVSAESLDADINSSNFSHTRVYDIAAGSHTFYGVGQNYVELDGSGIASVYGSLTVEFVPTSGTSTVDFAPVSTIVNDLSAPTELASITINPATDGKVVVHFDANVGPDVGDRIVVAASDNVGWTSNDGNIGVEVPNTDQNKRSFSHTRVYDVMAGSQTFYAVGQNYVEMDGNGSANFYGSLTVEFIPNATNSLVEADLSNVQVYPNPTNDFVYVSGINSNAQITVHTLAGNLVKLLETTLNEVQLDLSDLESGVYLLNVSSDNGFTSKRVIKK